MEDDNIFDKDDALDCILSEEYSREPKGNDNNSGCFSLIVFGFIPFGSGLFLMGKFIS